MAKTIKPQKLIIEIDSKGNYTEAILVYKIKDNETGEVDNKFNTISVKSKISVPIISTILKNAVDSVKEKEK